MDLSALSPVLAEIGDQGLETFDPSSAQSGQRLKGNGRQYVRFYMKKFTKPVTVKAKINPVTGSSTPLEVEMKEFNQEFVEIINPGDKNEFDGPVEHHHKVEFARQYIAFKQGRGAPVGKPVEECEYIPPHVLVDLKYNGCHTEEQLADASDVLCGIIPNGLQLRDFARISVKSAQDNKFAPQIEALQKQNAELVKQFEELKAKNVTSDGVQLSPKKPNGSK